MSQELETAAAASLPGIVRFRRRKEHVAPPGARCANCAAVLLGPWCHQCGQVAEDFHRSIWRLIGEVFEGLVHVDGRLWRTLPDLMSNPARLTRSYVAGHRAPQIPPLRLFLVVLLLIFIASGLGGRGTVINTVVKDNHGDVLTVKTRSLGDLTPAERAQAKAYIAGSQISLPGRLGETVGTWLKARMQRVIDDPERFKLVLEQWSERFAFLALPISALLLTLLFGLKRRFFIFDHTIFSLHSLSANGLVLAAATAFSRFSASVSDLLLLAVPVHLFIHMRGFYGLTVAGTLLRMLVLFLGSVVCASLAFAAFLAVGLGGMGG